MIDFVYIGDGVYALSHPIPADKWGMVSDLFIYFDDGDAETIGLSEVSVVRFVGFGTADPEEVMLRLSGTKIVKVRGYYRDGKFIKPHVRHITDVWKKPTAAPNISHELLPAEFWYSRDRHAPYPVRGGQSVDNIPLSLLWSNYPPPSSSEIERRVSAVKDIVREDSQTGDESRVNRESLEMFQRSIAASRQLASKRAKDSAILDGTRMSKEQKVKAYNCRNIAERILNGPNAQEVREAIWYLQEKDFGPWVYEGDPEITMLISSDLPEIAHRAFRNMPVTPLQREITRAQVEKAQKDGNLPSPIRAYIEAIDSVLTYENLSAFRDKAKKRREILDEFSYQDLSKIRTGEYDATKIKFSQEELKILAERLDAAGVGAPRAFQLANHKDDARSNGVLGGTEHWLSVLQQNQVINTAGTGSFNSASAYDKIKTGTVANDSIFFNPGLTPDRMQIDNFLREVAESADRSEITDYSRLEFRASMDPRFPPGGNGDAFMTYGLTGVSNHTNIYAIYSDLSIGPDTNYDELPMQETLYGAFRNVGSDESLSMLTELRSRLSDSHENVLESTVSVILGNWATTSNDDHPAAWYLQRLAEEEFGIADDAYWSNESNRRHAELMMGLTVRWEDGFTAKLKWDETAKARSVIWRAILRAQYDETQEILSNAGVKQIEVQRGMSLYFPAPVTAANNYRHFKAFSEYVANEDFSKKPGVSPIYFRPIDVKNGYDSSFVGPNGTHYPFQSWPVTKNGLGMEMHNVVIGAAVPFLSKWTVLKIDSSNTEDLVTMVSESGTTSVTIPIPKANRSATDWRDFTRPIPAYYEGYFRRPDTQPFEPVKVGEEYFSLTTAAKSATGWPVQNWKFVRHDTPVTLLDNDGKNNWERVSTKLADVAAGELIYSEYGIDVSDGAYIRGSRTGVVISTDFKNQTSTVRWEDGSTTEGNDAPLAMGIDNPDYDLSARGTEVVEVIPIMSKSWSQFPPASRLADVRFMPLESFVKINVLRDESLPEHRGGGSANDAVLAPLSSWTISTDTALNFTGAQSNVDAVITSIVPRERVMATAISGLGCYNEYEIVVLGGSGIKVREYRPNEFVDAMMPDPAHRSSFDYYDI